VGDLAVTAALGFSARTGWAAAVAVALDRGGRPVLLDRRMVELIDGTVPRQVYHAASGLPLDRAATMVRRSERVAGELAGAAVASMVDELASRGETAVAAGIPVGGSRVPAELETVLASHMLLHAAEGDLFRQALMAAADEHGLEVFAVPARDLMATAGRELGSSTEALRRTLTELGRPIGPPWRKDEKDATLAAWLALAWHPDVTSAKA
jgi:hypothetical protein